LNLRDVEYLISTGIEFQRSYHAKIVNRGVRVYWFYIVKLYNCTLWLGLKYLPYVIGLALWNNWKKYWW